MARTERMADLVEPLALASTVAEARDALAPLTGVPFARVFPPAALDAIARSKGGVGLAIERLAGVEASPRHLDLPARDGYGGGEIKTVSSRDGRLAERVPVCTLGTDALDELLAGVPFPSSVPGTKLRELLVVRIRRVGPAASWCVEAVDAFLAGDPAWDASAARLAREYREIGYELAAEVDREGLVLSGTAGRGRILQVGTKGEGHGRGGVRSWLLGGPGTDKGRGLFLTRAGLQGLLDAA